MNSSVTFNARWDHTPQYMVRSLEVPSLPSWSSGCSRKANDPRAPGPDPHHWHLSERPWKPGVIMRQDSWGAAAPKMHHLDVGYVGNAFHAERNSAKKKDNSFETTNLHIFTFKFCMSKIWRATHSPKKTSYLCSITIKIQSASLSWFIPRNRTFCFQFGGR